MLPRLMQVTTIFRRNVGSAFVAHSTGTRLLLMRAVLLVCIRREVQGSFTADAPLPRLLRCHRRK
jgi:hypothetical protein